MKVSVNNELYEMDSAVMFVSHEGDTFKEFTVKFPSGRITEFLVFEDEDEDEAIQRMMCFFIEEFMLEDDEKLSRDAIILKNDLRELFTYKG